MSETAVLSARDDDIVTITINRPDAFNALNRRTHELLNSAVKDVSMMSPLPRVLILTGAGDKAFVGGLDPAELLRFSPSEGLYMSRIGQETCRLLDRMPIVTIAAVNGVAVGGGLELSLASDLVVASTNAAFIQVEALAGVVPGFGGTWRLQRRVGAMRARLMALTGRPVDAATGVAWGLALEMVEPDELLSRVKEIAGWVIAAEPEAVRQTKRLIADFTDAPLDAANAAEQAVFGARFGTPGMVEAMGRALAESARILSGK